MRYNLSEVEWQEYKSLKDSKISIKDKVIKELCESFEAAIKTMFIACLLIFSILIILCISLGYLIGI